VLVVEADRAKATQVGERIRAAIESTPIVQHGYCFGITVSIGVAVSPTSTAGIETLLTEADQILYAAKRAGRNRVLSTSDVPDTVDWSI
jgi:diguanylate cyclase (GGDEF)-like protein